MRRIKNTDKLPRVYGGDDARLGRLSRIGAKRQRAAEEQAEAAQAAAEQAVATAEEGFAVEDIVGTSFPTAPVDGHPFIRSDLDWTLFVFDGDRRKWLSAHYTDVPTFSSQALVAAGAFLRTFQGPTSSTTDGYRLPWDSTLVEIVSSRATSGASTQFDIRSGGSVTYSHTIASGDETTFETDIDQDFSANVNINVQANTDVTGGGTITLKMKRRAT